MKRGMRAAACLFAALSISGAGLAQEPVKVKGYEESGKLTVKDTGEKVKIRRSGTKYKIKETGEKFKIKETRSGGKVKGTSVKIKPASREGRPAAVRPSPASMRTPAAVATPAAPPAGAAENP